MSAETKWTPGPWAAEGVLVTSKSTTVVGTRGAVDCEVIRKVVDCTTGRDDMNYPEAEANARLIAEAPAMAVIVRESLALIRIHYGEATDAPDGVRELIGAIKDVLARVRGAA